MRKNVASQVVCGQLVALADGTDVTSGTTNVYVLGDGGTQSAGGGTVTHEGNGTWSYVPTQAETNYAHIAFTFKNALAVSSTVNIYTVGQDFTASTLNCTVTTNNDKTGYSLSSGGIQAIWDALTSALTTVGSVGKRISDYLTGDAYVRLGAPAGASVSADVAAIKAETAEIGSPAGVSVSADIAAVKAETALIKLATDEIGSPAGVSVSADIAAIKAETASIQTDTNDIQSRLPAALVGGQMDSTGGASATDIRDAVWAKTLTELSSVPGVTTDVLSALNWVFTLDRNKRTQTAATETVFKDNGSTTLATSTKSDDGTTFTRGEYI